MLVSALARGQVANAPAARVRYGTGDTSFGELLPPPGKGPFPVAVLLKADEDT
jgi:hypothetical protein